MSYLNISKYFFSIVVASLLDPTQVFQSITHTEGQLWPHFNRHGSKQHMSFQANMAFQFAVNQPMSNHLRDIVQPVDPLVCFFRFSFNTFFLGWSLTGSLQTFIVECVCVFGYCESKVQWKVCASPSRSIPALNCSQPVVSCLSPEYLVSAFCFIIFICKKPI